MAETVTIEQQMRVLVRVMAELQHDALAMHRDGKDAYAADLEEQIRVLGVIHKTLANNHVLQVALRRLLEPGGGGGDG